MDHLFVSIFDLRYSEVVHILAVEPEFYELSSVSLDYLPLVILAEFSSLSLLCAL